MIEFRKFGKNNQIKIFFCNRKNGKISLRLSNLLNHTCIKIRFMISSKIELKIYKKT